MLPRYERNIPALSEGECKLLAGKRVAVIGCGGLGGHLIELLARVGVGSLVAVDGDSFDESNLNRQLLSRTEYLGRNKALCAAEHIKSVNPHVNVEARSLFLTEDNAAELICGCDIVMDALDNIDARRALSAACRALGIPYVYGGISGWLAQCGLSMPGDGLIELLFPEGCSIGDKSVLSFTPALCASMQAALCVKYLSGRHVDSGKVYCFDLLDMEFESICLSLTRN